MDKVNMQVPKWLRDALKIEAAIQHETMADLIVSACIARYDRVREDFNGIADSAIDRIKAEQG